MFDRSQKRKANAPIHRLSSRIPIFKHFLYLRISSFGVLYLAQTTHTPTPPHPHIHPTSPKNGGISKETFLILTPQALKNIGKCAFKHFLYLAPPNMVEIKIKHILYLATQPPNPKTADNRRFCLWIPLG